MVNAKAPNSATVKYAPSTRLQFDMNRISGSILAFESFGEHRQRLIGRKKLSLNIL